MTEQEQQIALCEWAGWTDFKETVFQDHKFWTGISPHHAGKFRLTLPDTNSLDVLHSFEERLNPNQIVTYVQTLIQSTRCENRFEVMNRFAEIHATAEQRRRALLMTLNLWREDSK